MERRITVQDLKNDMEQVIQAVQAGETAIIEQEDGSELILISREAFDRVQATYAASQPVAAAHKPHPGG